MKHKTKVLALILAVLMTVTLFAGCGGGNDTAETTVDSTNSSETIATTAPEVNYNGYKFMIADEGFNEVMPKFTPTGDLASELDKEWEDLYLALEEKLNIEIVYNTMDGDQLGAITTAGMAGTKIADIIMCRQYEFWPPAKSGYLLPVDGEKLKDLGLDCTDETRWYQPTIKESKAFGNLWGLDVASKFVSAPTGYFVAFNKEMVKAAGYDDLYSKVKDGSWTWDVYLDIATKCTKDTNGDGINETWGTGATAWGVEVTTNGCNYVDEDSTGKWVTTIDSQAGIDALNFLLALNTNGSRLDEGSGVCHTAFAAGTIAFDWINMGHINGPTQTVYNSAHDYGIVPMPKGPAAAGYTGAHSDNDLYVIQSANKDLETVIPILNEWALIVNDTESYLDVLDDGRCRTQADKEMMIDYIIPNFALCHVEITEEIATTIDEGIISGVSYNGMTARQAVDANKAALQGLLDDFFNS